MYKTFTLHSLSRPAQWAETEAAHFEFVSPVCVPLPPSPLAQVDVPGKHGDQQYDGEAGEQPCILDQEEDDFGGRPLLFL